MKKQLAILTLTLGFSVAFAAPPAGRGKLKLATPDNPHTVASVTNAADLQSLQADAWAFVTTNFTAANLVALNAVEPRSNNIVRVQFAAEITKEQFAQLKAKVAESVDGVSQNTGNVELQFRYQRFIRRIPNPANTNEVLVETTIKPNGFIHLREKD